MFIVLILLIAAVIAVILWVSRPRSFAVNDYPLKESESRRLLVVTSNDEDAFSQYSFPIFAALCETKKYDFKIASDRFDYAANHLDDYDAICIVSNKVVFANVFLDLWAHVPDKKVAASETCRTSYFCDNIFRALDRADFDELIRAVYSPDILILDTAMEGAKALLNRIRHERYPPDDERFIQPLPLKDVAHTTAAYGMISGPYNLAVICDRADAAREHSSKVTPIHGTFKYWKDL